MELTRVEAIKQYMGTEKPVTFEELKELGLHDKPGFQWMAEECAKRLGATLKVS